MNPAESPDKYYEKQITLSFRWASAPLYFLAGSADTAKSLALDRHRV
jgi:hypothetical protein